MAHVLALTVDGRPAEVELVVEDGELRVRLGDRWHTAQLEKLNQSGLYWLLVDGHSWEIFVRERPGGFELLLGNRVYEIDVGRKRGEEPAAEATGAWTLVSPMAGQLVELRVAAGDTVESGQCLVLIESMKMNNELTAARSGTVSEVLVSAGERVERGRPLLRIT